jgi:hypothetical protein
MESPDKNRSKLTNREDPERWSKLVPVGVRKKYSPVGAKKAALLGGGGACGERGHGAGAIGEVLHGGGAEERLLVGGDALSILRKRGPFGLAFQAAWTCAGDRLPVQRF